MIAAIKQLKAARKAQHVAREVGVSAHTIYALKLKYRGMDVSATLQPKRLRDDSARPRMLVVDLSLKTDALQLTALPTGNAIPTSNAHTAV